MLIIDLHVHSRFAYATSKRLNLRNMYHWAKLKGIEVVGTGDFTHPTWLAEIEEFLQEQEDGLFSLKTPFREQLDASLPVSVSTAQQRFILTTEISCVYKKSGKLRKVHHVVVASSLAAMKTINQELSKHGNLAADGRPTVTISSRELLQLVYEVDDQAMFIPAHIWTPWFGLFGSKSGYDSLEEAFGSDSKYVTALETGLSSDPRMNRLLSQHDQIAVISNSDAHSLEKLAREATLLEIEELSYQQIREAITSNDQRLVGTIEFYPEEGKYHWDGHRKCGFVCSPEETKERRGVCPVCQKKLTVGVEYRVSSLADRTESKQEKRVDYIIPLAELISAATGVKSTTSKTVLRQYHQMIERFGSEFHILSDLDLQSQGVDSKLTTILQAIAQMRNGEVKISPGYDGRFGLISLKEEEITTQQSLF